MSIIRSGCDAKWVYYGHHCHLAAMASRPSPSPTSPPPLLVLLPMPANHHLLRLRRNSSLKSSTHAEGDDNGDDGAERRRQGWEGRLAGWPADNGAAGNSVGRPPVPAALVHIGPAWMVDRGVYLSMLATSNRAGLSAAVELSIHVWAYKFSH